MRAVFLVALSVLTAVSGLKTALGAEARDLQSLGMGHAHMAVSCSPAVSKKFDTALALLHNFWYPRALSGFNDIVKTDPECGMAYWGAAMTKNHPFWDAPTQGDEQGAWGAGTKGNERERAVAPRTDVSQRSCGALPGRRQRQKVRP